MTRARPTMVALLIGLSAIPAFAGGNLHVIQATWKVDRSELKIEGTSDKIDDVVLLRDPETRTFLGSAAVRRDGRWLLKIRNPDRVPSRLTVVCGRDSTECAVEKISEKIAQVRPQVAQ